MGRVSSDAISMLFSTYQAQRAAWAESDSDEAAAAASLTWRHLLAALAASPADLALKLELLIDLLENDLPEEAPALAMARSIKRDICAVDQSIPTSSYWPETDRERRYAWRT